ncbi:MAG: YhcH/YjgK/YiaL family protein [Clostridiales bacterium]|jgi:YhcH/YjgK/YiaL family protein|nr:YhcH/YjgK/YiaL family protein [Clostridiales bacterium]
MVFDSKEHLHYYKSHGIGDRYEKAVNFLLENDHKDLSPGRHEIDGDSVYANVAEYATVPWEKAAYESHRNYTDIQYIISGKEIMTFAAAGSLEVSGAYNAEKDVLFFENTHSGTQFQVSDDQYLIFKPGEIHKSKGLIEKSSPIKKIVVKIKEI